MIEDVQAPTRGGAREGSGQPTYYHDGIPQNMLDFFDVDSTETYIVTDENGNEQERLRATLFRTFEGYAKLLGVSRGTLYLWKKKHKAFRKAWRRCVTMQHEYILVNGMAGLTNPGFTKFAAINMMKWKDKCDVTSNNKDVAPTTFTLKIGDD